MNEDKVVEEEFDVLDMHNYRMEKLPAREKSKFERFLMMLGAPIAILSFILIMFFVDIPFINNFVEEFTGWLDKLIPV